MRQSVADIRLGLGPAGARMLKKCRSSSTIKVLSLVMPILKPNTRTLRETAPMQNSNFTFIDLFAGIGGMRLGFESAGGKCVFSSEWDQNCQRTYEANFGVLPDGDITQIEVDEVPKCDVILAGFPCQPFSSIGQRAGFDHPTQGTLFYDVLRLVKGLRPKHFCLKTLSAL